jgi:hypothetical protein
MHVLIGPALSFPKIYIKDVRHSKFNYTTIKTNVQSKTINYLLGEKKSILDLPTIITSRSKSYSSQTKIFSKTINSMVRKAKGHRY